MIYFFAVESPFVLFLLATFAWSVSVICFCCCCVCVCCCCCYLDWMLRILLVDRTCALKTRLQHGKEEKINEMRKEQRNNKQTTTKKTISFSLKTNKPNTFSVYIDFRLGSRHGCRFLFVFVSDQRRQYCKIYDFASIPKRICIFGFEHTARTQSWRSDSPQTFFFHFFYYSAFYQWVWSYHMTRHMTRHMTI